MSVKASRISGSHGIYVGYGTSVNPDASTANTFESNVLLEK